jgi:hypothetical protein
MRLQRGLILLAVFGGGCDSRFASMSDEVLQEKMHACRTTVEQSPGFAISCDNYRRECDRRRKEGRFVC